MSENIFYNYDRIISYNAFLNILVGSRGVGKTYGFSKFAVKQFLKYKRRFVLIRRFKSEIEDAFDEFFEKLIKNNEFPDLKLSAKGGKFYINNELAGYTMTLSTAGKKKSKNYLNVKYIVFDEFIIEEGQGYYLKNEVKHFLGAIETIGRLEDLKVFLLGNAVTENNPYYLYFNLERPYNNDIKLFKDGLILIQYIVNEEYIKAKKETRFGRLVAGTDYEDYAINNNFIDNNNNFIEKKNGSSKFMFSFAYKNNKYGVWVDYNNGKMYISRDYIENGLCFATTTQDHSPNTLLYSIAKKYTCWKMFIENYKLGNVYFENVKIKNISKEVLKNIILRS